MNEWIGTKEAATITGLSQSTIQKRCREGKYKSAEQDDKLSPWRILKDEVLSNEKLCKKK